MDTSVSPSVWDAIVVGGGAAGLSAALMLGRARRRVLVIDAGSPRNRFADHMHGILGNEGSTPAALLQKGRAEAAEYGVEFRDDTVTGIQDADRGLSVTVSAGRLEQARTLIVATGITDELPDTPGLRQRWGTSVLHCPYCHGWEVRDQRIGVLATSPMSLHQARLVRQWSDQVVLFSAAIGDLDPADRQRLQARDIEIVTSPVVEVLGHGYQTTGVLAADGQVTELTAIFTAGVPRPHDGFLAGLNLARTTQPFGLGAFLTVDQAGKTSHDRIWAVGNVTHPMANVPMAIGAGSFAGGAVNGALVEEEFDLALTQARR